MVNEKLGLKAYPGVRMVHSPVEAAESIIEENNIELRDVDTINVKVTSIAKDHVGWDYEPRGVTSALSNIQYGIASALINDKIDVDSYTETSIKDRRVLEMIKHIRVEGDRDLEGADPYSMGSIVEIKLTNTRTFQKYIEYPKGTPKIRPLTEIEVLSKFKNLVADEERANKIIEFVKEIEQKQDVVELASLLEYKNP